MKLAKIEQNGTLAWMRVKTPESGVILPKIFSLENWREFRSFDGQSVPLEHARFLAPVVDAPKVICIGKNYADHAAEMGGSVPELPIIFSKFHSAINAPFGDVALPAISSQVDFEAELVVVIGRRGKNISRERAFDHVLGYMCGNDVSARDWQKGRPGGQWLVGKSFDGFAPVGPWLTTADEVADVGDLEVSLRLNGQIMQKANTKLLIYPVDHLVSYISQFFTLEVGDLIFTGTPAGVGAGRNPPVFLKQSDTAEVSISSLGSIQNRFV